MGKTINLILIIIAAQWGLIIYLLFRFSAKAKEIQAQLDIFHVNIAETRQVVYINKVLLDEIKGLIKEKEKE